VAVGRPARPGDRAPGLRSAASAIAGLFGTAVVAAVAALLLAESLPPTVLAAVVVAAVLAAVAGLIGTGLLVAIGAVRREVAREIDAIVARTNRTAAETAQQVAANVELGVLSALPPARALEAVIGSVYGRSDSVREVVTSLLGGEGHQPDRSDLTISEHTDVEYRLNRVDEDSYQLAMQVGYSFKTRVPADKFVIFATSDATLRESIVLGCRQPLFELWFVSDDDPINPRFHEVVDGMLPSVRIGLRFADEQGHQHEIVDCRVDLAEVRVGRWEEYLTFFREPLGALPRLRPENYMSSLRMFEIDLRKLVEPGLEVASIQRLSLRSTTVQRVDDGFCYWQAPYPCFVDRLHIDAAPLSLSGPDEFRFLVQTFTFGTQLPTSWWSPADEVAELTVRSWLLPGHGFVLLWKRVLDDWTERQQHR
jgi:hypothetical protein